MADTPKHSVSVAGIVVDDRGRVLIIRRRDNGHWEPPGGVLEIGESFEDGVRREVEEETGLPVAVEQLTGVYKNMQRAVVALVFRCHPLGERPRETAEAADVRWVDPAEIPSLMDPAYAVRVTDALSNAAPATRVHDGVRLIDA
ncbi:NUDIX hydrolase [Pseudonocardia cypriaca]|uniref:ADP-ribose pyrophosphatase YjhB (NUDIX family) n=1 Tax=Pseudonocardia cypriaca TaxID=882449 RepID=A0A543FZC3_9PSEU|nr:NUDIX domain-containing protein [Pseudonocardia cypriaca]TQM39179.1 ADP-ribose pyrophosphatase YjhB (NUDIX family) [Pseudonocardia cypriaca]